MSPDELRALAKALNHMGLAPCKEAADYLRACADAQPVGWMHPDGRVVPTATMDQAYRDGGAMQSSLRDYTIPLYAAPVPPQAAPVPPQAEPSQLAGQEISLGALMREQRQSRIVAGAYPDGNPNAGAMMAQTPQAWPQREPLSDGQLASVCLSYRHDFGLLDKYERDCIVNEARRWADAFRIGGSDAK